MTEFNNLSEEQLQSMIENAEKALKEKQVGKRKEGIAEIKRIAASLGLSVELREADKQASGRKIGSVAPKYRNPANADETWTGRGVAPKWMQALQNEGRDKSEFLI